MSINFAMPGTNVRHLGDGALANRLATDISRGLHNGTRTGLIGGVVMPFDFGDQRDRNGLAWAVSNPRPGTRAVTRHGDGSIDVQLATGISVHLYPGREAVR